MSLEIQMWQKVNVGGTGSVCHWCVVSTELEGTKLLDFIR